MPTLIADGVADQLAPAANDQILAGLIPGARLVLYPDAGHAFLFQEGTPFASLAESFLPGTQARSGRRVPVSRRGRATRRRAESGRWRPSPIPTPTVPVRLVRDQVGPGHMA
jgi:hypothetical protein